MTSDKGRRTEPKLLRQRARERMRERKVDPEQFDPQDMRSALEELQVHQFELEIQNEELHTTQVELADSRDRYRALYEFAPVGYLSIDEEDHILELNRTAGGILGGERERLVGVRLSDFVAPESYDDYRRHREAVRATGESRDCELALHTVGGRRWYVELHSSREAAPPGELRCALNDITARRRTEHALAERTAEVRASEARLRTIVDTVPTAILTVGERGRIASANPAAERVFGCSAQDLVGRSLTELLTEAYAREYERYLDDPAACTDWPEQREISARRADGAMFPAEAAIAAVEDAALCVVALRDLTETRHLEHEVLNAVETERFRIGSDLHDGVAQQLAGLAMTARGLANRLQQRTVPEAELADTVNDGLQQAGRDLRAAIHDLSPLDMQGADLRTCLEALAQDATDRMGIDCSVHGDANTEPDPRAGPQLLRIAREAVQNAWKHGRPTEVRIHLDDYGHGVQLAIRDDGVGCDADNPEGMGLRIMRYRARLLGARLEVGNCPEGGTVVTCTLPGTR